MRVTLVRPPFMGTRFGPPTGLAYLSASLQEAGHRVEVLDLNTLIDERLYDLSDYTRDFVLRPGHPALAHAQARLPEFGERILATRPEAVGFSLSYPTLEMGLALASRLPAGIRRIAGGPQANFHPEQLLANGSFDAVVQGYGEEAIPAALEQDGLLAAPLIRGKDYRPDYRGIEPVSYGGRLSIVTSRGCPNRCAFCTQHLEVHHHSIESVVEQVRDARGVRELTFNDSTINASERRAAELFRQLAALEEVPPSHVFGLQVRRGYQRYVSLMAPAGVREVRLGIESGSPRERNSMNKPRFDNDLVLEVVRDLAHSGIVVWTQFIFCYPDQTDEDRGQTLDLMHRINGACPPGRVRHFWYRFMVHHGVEDLFRERYGVRAASPSDWTNPLYDPQRVMELHQSYREQVPRNAQIFV